MSSKPHLTARLELRPLRASDYEAWRDGYLRQTRPLKRHDPRRKPAELRSRSWFLGLIRSRRKRARADDAHIFGVFHRKTGEYLGHVDLATIARINIQWANLGYALLNQHRGQGYGTEAARGALEIAFRRLGYHRVEAAINLDNPRSIQVARKLGMKRECVRRAFFHEFGRWTDNVVYVAFPETIGLRSRRPPSPGA